VLCPVARCLTSTRRRAWWCRPSTGAASTQCCRPSWSIYRRRRCGYLTEGFRVQIIVKARLRVRTRVRVRPTAPCRLLRRLGLHVKCARCMTAMYRRCIETKTRQALCVMVTEQCGQACSCVASMPDVLFGVRHGRAQRCNSTGCNHLLCFLPCSLRCKPSGTAAHMSSDLRLRRPPG